MKNENEKNEEWNQKKTLHREAEEAVEAGERALFSLRAAREKLDSARNWGIFDMLGGGFVTDMVKHSRLRDAGSYLEQAKRNLLLFQKELRDVPIPDRLQVEIGGFLCFADFFFDGIVTDYLVQTKIAEARQQVEEAIVRIEEILVDLRSLEQFE